MTGGVVIVGTGIAGMTAAQTLRDNGFGGPVTVIGSEPEDPYRRTALSKDLLRADLSADRIRLRPSAFWTEKNIEVCCGVMASDLDTAGRLIGLSDGRTLPYDALILATGGRAASAEPMAGVPTLRTRSDAQRIRESIADTGRVSVVGGGLIGLEIAASAAAAGYPVDVVERAHRVMERVVPEIVSEVIAELHSERGVVLRCGARVASADAAGLTLSGGARLDGPVVAALGLRPDVTLAVAAGIEVAAAGIHTDDHLRTSADGVYAAGDVAAPPHPRTGRPARTENWMSATKQGMAAALSVSADLAGGSAPAYREVPLAWTIHYGVNFQIAGWPASGTRYEIDGSLAERDAVVRCFDDRQLVGAVAIGRPRAGRTAREEITAELTRLTV
ncbi:NAD(P)/FAD-dependent oxidoreductase [Gordonia sp. NPDC003950]